MALTTPNDRTLLNIVAHYDRELPGKQLTQGQLLAVAETAKRMILDELHSAKVSVRQ